MHKNEGSSSDTGLLAPDQQHHGALHHSARTKHTPAGKLETQQATVRKTLSDISKTNEVCLYMPRGSGVQESPQNQAEIPAAFRVPARSKQISCLEK